MEFLELDKELNLTEIHVDHSLTGKILEELNLRQKYHITALVLKRNGHQQNSSLARIITLMLDDCLVIVGRQNDIERYFS